MVWFMWVLFCSVSFAVLKWFLSTRRVSNYQSKHVFITGCDSGFGNMLAKRLDSMGFVVYAGCLTAVGQQSVRTQCSERTVPVHIDVTSDKSIEKAVEQVKRCLPKDGGLWAVVNNAGVRGGVGPTSWQTQEDYDKTLAVNLYGVIFVTKAFLPLVILAKGRIINMSSTFGRIAVVAVSYTVSKYGVEAFSDILRREMLSSGVTVSIIEPGVFNTTLLNEEEYRKAAKEKIDSLPAEVRKSTPDVLINRVMNTVTFIKQKLASNDTYKVVDAYVDAITARYPKTRYLVGTDSKYVFRVLWNLPEWMSDRLLMLRYSW